MNIKLAVISDIHSNIFALEEVLKDIKKRKVDFILNLGDSLYGSIDPKGCADILISSSIISICGNEDSILLEKNVNTNDHKSFLFTCDNIKDHHFNWIKSLPFDKIINEQIYICHGTPCSFNKYLIEDVSLGFPKIKEINELQKCIESINQKIIICGHSHLQNVIKINDKTIINPGSVGIQAYDDTTPVYHIMQSGSPHTRYSILHINGGNVQIENLALKYDWNLAAKTAKKNGREDWGNWLKTGRVK